MDLSTIVPSAITVDVRHPKTQESTGLRLTIVSDDADQVIAARRKLFDESRQKGRKLTDAEEAELHLALQLAHVTGWEWTGEANFAGDKPEFTAQALRDVVGKVPAVRNAIALAIRDEAAFYKG